MARPRKAEEERRTATMGVRLTLAELAAIEARASQAGLKPSDYVRRVALLQRVTAKRPERIKAEAITALLRLGVNLNQLTRRANMGTFQPADMEDLRDLLRIIDDHIRKLEE